MQKLAIVGGTFNPVHWGHLLMAETALDQYQLDQVFWVPTPYPPHRSHIGLVDTVHRVEMVKIAIASHPAFSLSTVDLKRSGTSYAINTLVDLQTLHSDSQWYWILGLDAFQSLPRWYRRHELAEQCHWLVVPRILENGARQQQCEQVVKQMREQGITLHWSLLQMPLVEISSSLIRQYCSDRRSIRYLVPDLVFSYIQTHRLYA